jgi:hypothetical protein
VGRVLLGVVPVRKVTRAGEDRVGLLNGWFSGGVPLPEARTEVELDLLRLSRVWEKQLV